MKREGKRGFKTTTRGRGTKDKNWGLLRVEGEFSEEETFLGRGGFGSGSRKLPCCGTGGKKEQTG